MATAASRAPWRDPSGPRVTSRDPQEEEWCLYKASEADKIVRVSEQEDHHEHKIDKEAQSVCCPGECAVPPSVVVTEEHGRNISLLGNTELHRVESDCTWAALGGLVGPLGTTAKSPETKSGGNIPWHMAQFARIMCLEMWDLCPCLLCVYSCVWCVHE